jgi:hypothetical protein
MEDDRLPESGLLVGSRNRGHLRRLVRNELLKD